MVAIDHFPSAPFGISDPSAQPNAPDIDTFLRERQERAARSSATIGEFARQWKRDVADVLLPRAKGEGAQSFEDWRPRVEERGQVIDAATRGNEELRVAPLDPEEGGENRIGAGRGGILINQFQLAQLGEKRTAKEFRIIPAHEDAHGRSVHLHGRLLDKRRQAVDPMLLYEGYAEISSMDEEGGGIDQTRADQPETLYGEGQRLVLAIIRRVGREKLEETLTGDGDLERLQPAFSDN